MGGWVGGWVGQKRFYNPLWLFRAQLGFRIQVRAECGNKNTKSNSPRLFFGIDEKNEFYARTCDYDLLTNTDFFSSILAPKHTVSTKN